MKNKILIPLFILCTAYLTIYLFQIPVFHLLKDWFWSYNAKNLSAWYFLIFDFCVLIVATYLLLNKKFSNSTIIFSILALGTFHQFSLELSENKGLQVPIDKMLKTGHSEFVRVAVTHSNLFYVISNYEELLKKNELGKFPNSKPPGTLATYIAIHNIADYILPSDNYNQKVYNAALLSSIIFPFISYLVIIPLFLTLNTYTNQITAIIASLFYITTPATNLIIMHLDFVLFPLLFIAAIYLINKGIVKHNYWILFLAGGFCYLSIFFSFSLLPIFVYFFLIFAFKIAEILYRISSFKPHSLLSDFELQRQVKMILFSISGFVCLMLIFTLFLNYDFLIRQSNSLQYHFQWKKWENTPKKIIYYAGLNTVDYFCGVGIALTYFWVLSFYKYFTSIYKYCKLIRLKKWSSIKLLSTDNYCAFLSFFLFIVFVILWGFAKTKGETARLWIFLTPIVCIITANYLTRKFGNNSQNIVGIVIILQLLTTYVLKYSQDFEYLG